MGSKFKIAVLLVVLISLPSAIIRYQSKISDIYNSISYSSQKSGNIKRLVIGRANDSISLDPGNITDIDSIRATVNIFETLVKYEKEGKEIIPGLATSWNASEDGLTWRFNLRQGVKFHDGTVFNADAVIFNFKRWMYKDNPYHIGQFYYWNYVFGGFPGLIKSISALSNYSIEIRLNKPYAPFLSTLAMPVFGIASPEAIKKYKDEVHKHPVGTGPFIFKNWEPNKSIILIKNENYWGVMPKVDEIEFKVIKSNINRLEELKQGKIHIADDLGPDDVDFIQNETNIKLLLRPCFNVGYLALNNEKSPFNKKDVRLAISSAIDKDEMIRDVFKSFAKPAKTFIPPMLIGYDEGIQQSEVNIEKSRQLLKKAGYPNGFKTTLWVMDTPRSYMPKPIETAEYIKKCLEKINISVAIKVFSWDEYLDKIKNGEHEMALIGWTGDNIDPDNFLNTMLSSNNAIHGYAGNYSFYKNMEVDMLLFQARQTNDIVFRKVLYRRILEIVNEDMPSIPLVHTMPVLAADLSVKGYIPYITGVESLEKVEIESKN